MNRSRMTLLGLAVFGLILLSFLIRGFGQLVFTQRTASLLAAPVILLAVALIVFLVAYWVLARIGLTTIEDDG